MILHFFNSCSYSLTSLKFLLSVLQHLDIGCTGGLYKVHLFFNSKERIKNVCIYVVKLYELVIVTNTNSQTVTVPPINLCICVCPHFLTWITGRVPSLSKVDLSPCASPPFLCLEDHPLNRLFLLDRAFMLFNNWQCVSPKQSGKFSVCLQYK